MRLVVVFEELELVFPLLSIKLQHELRVTVNSAAVVALNLQQIL